MKNFVGNSDCLFCSESNSNGRNVTIGTGGNADENCSEFCVIPG